MKKDYWLVLDSYVFLWSDDKTIVVYNVLSGKGFKTRKISGLDAIVEKLKDKKNLYVTSVNDELLKIPEIKLFIQQIRLNFCGDMYDKDQFPNKPIVAIPKVSINTNPEAGNIPEEKQRFGEYISDNLLGITIQLTGRCTENCLLCGEIDKQISWCNKNENILDIDKLVILLEKINILPVFDVNFIGGNILEYPYWSEFLEKTADTHYRKTIKIHERLVNTEKIREILNSGFHVIILAEPDSLFEIEMDEKEITYLYYISSYDEYKLVHEKNTKHAKIKILPLYTENNKSFFEEFIFQEENDILETAWELKNIFAHQVVNTNDFGMFYINAEGKIFANIHEKPIGIIEDDFSTIIYQEIKSGKSWRRTRDKLEPCKKCVYKYLCPSPSNYERVIKKNNLCNYDIYDNFIYNKHIKNNERDIPNNTSDMVWY